MKKVEFNRSIKSFKFPRSVAVLGGEDVSLMVHINCVEDDTHSSNSLNMTGEQAAQLGAALIEAALGCDRDAAIKAMEAVRFQLFAEEADEVQA
jgi:hypothetical protein